MVPKEGESDDIYINIRDNKICFNNIYYIAKACYLYFTYMMNTTNVTVYILFTKFLPFLCFLLNRLSNTLYSFLYRNQSYSN